MIESGYSREDIEKYLLLIDPSFYQYYYQNGGQGNVYNIKCTTAAPAKVTLPVVNTKAKGVKAKKAKKEKKNFFKKLFAGAEE